MPAPPAYLDECVDHYLVGALRERGFLVTHAVDEGMAQRRDEEHLLFAMARDMRASTLGGHPKRAGDQA